MSRRFLSIFGLVFLIGCAPSAPPAQPAAKQPAATSVASAPTSVPTRAAAPAAQSAARPTAAAAQPAAATQPAAAAQPTAAPKVTGAAPSGTATVVQGPTITHLDSSMETGMVTFNPSIHIFDTLTWRDDESNIRPRLATEWSYPNEKTIRMKIRKGVTFHNGDPLTTDDVVFTYQRVIDPASNSKHITYVKTIGEVRKVDEETVEFGLKTPDATLLGRFSLIPIVPKKVYEALGPDGFNEKPVGTGPYTLQEWVKGQRVVLKANPGYWRGPAKIETLVFKSISEDNTRVAELLTGNADIVTNVPPELATQVKASTGAAVQEIQSLRNVHVRVNTKKAPYNDVRVRQALNHAIDVQLLISSILGGYGVATPGGVMGPGVWGHNPTYTKGYDYDPAKARELLAAAGIPAGTKVELQSAQGRLLGDREVVQALSGMLQNVGLAADIRMMDYDLILNEFTRQYNEAMGLQLSSNANNTADADYNYSLNFLSTNRGLYWSTPEADALINKARAAMDEPARLAVYQELGGIIVKEAPVIFLYDQVDAYGVNKRLQGYKARADELIYLYEAAVN